MLRKNWLMENGLILNIENITVKLKETIKLYSLKILKFRKDSFQKF